MLNELCTLIKNAAGTKGVMSDFAVTDITVAGQANCLAMGS